MRLEVIDHGGTGASKEFIVAAPKFNFKKWLTLTLALSFISITCEIYISDLRILGAILCLLCFALLVKLHKKIKLESLLVVSSFGLQHTTMYASGRRETFFLSRQRLKSVLIVEGISMQKVLFYLAIVLNSKTDLLPSLPPTVASKRKHVNSTASPQTSNDQSLPNECSRENEQKLSTELQPEFSASAIISTSPLNDASTSTTSSLVNCRSGNRISAADFNVNDVNLEPKERISTDDIVYPLFQSLWPRLDVLTLVYRGVQKTLFPNNHDS